MRKALVEWTIRPNKSQVRPTETPDPSPLSPLRAHSIHLPAEYLDGFVEIQDDVVLFVHPSIAALLPAPARLKDVVGKSLTHFALFWEGHESTRSKFLDMASGCCERCHTPSVVSGKELEWTAFRSRDRVGRSVLLATVREHQEHAALSVERASYESPSANKQGGTVGFHLDERVLHKTSVAMVVSDRPTNNILDMNAATLTMFHTRRESLLGKPLSILFNASSKISSFRQALGPPTNSGIIQNTLNRTGSGSFNGAPETAVIRTPPLKAIERPTGSDAFQRPGDGSSDGVAEVLVSSSTQDLVCSMEAIVPQDIEVPCRVEGIKMDGQIFPCVFAQSAIGDSRILSHFMDITNQVQVEELEKHRQKKQNDALKEEKQKLEENAFCLEGNTLPLHWLVVLSLLP
jgi:hypothetical protein